MAASLKVVICLCSAAKVKNQIMTELWTLKRYQSIKIALEMKNSSFG